MEFLIIGSAIVIGGAGIVYWLNITDEWRERDQLRRFQEAMKAPGKTPPFKDEP